MSDYSSTDENESSPGSTPKRKSSRLVQAQQESRHRMLSYIAASVNPLLDDGEEMEGLTSNAFPAKEAFSEDPKEPLIESLPPMMHTSPRGVPYSGVLPETRKTAAASASSLASTPRQSYDLFSLSFAELRYLFSSLPDVYFPRRKIHLPKKAKTLVLDLDETLIHSTCKSTGQPYDMMIEVLMDKNSCLYYVTQRPFCTYFLKKVSEWYNLVIYTASLPEYADPVIDWLDNGARILQKRFFRASCIQMDGLYLKDLTLADKDLGRVLLIDNSPMSFIINPENCIPIKTWIHDKKDEALLDLLPFLDALRFTEDVRSVLSMRKKS